MGVSQSRQLMWRSGLPQALALQFGQVNLIEGDAQFAVGDCGRVYIVFVIVEVINAMACMSRLSIA